LQELRPGDGMGKTVLSKRFLRAKKDRKTEVEVETV
jgi:hypothetical protein